MVTGSGNIAIETRPLEAWSAVSLSCPGTLELERGENLGITIEAEDNILPLIETYVDGNRLVVRFAPGPRSVRPTQPIRFQATTPDIEVMTISGAGDIRAPRIEREHLALDVSGSGSIDVASAAVSTLASRISGSGSLTVRGDAVEHDVRISGSGNLHAREVTSQRAHVEISGSGNAMMRVEREIEGRISGSGSIVYSGQPNVSLRTSGSGRAVQMPES